MLYFELYTLLTENNHWVKGIPWGGEPVHRHETRAGGGRVRLNPDRRERAKQEETAADRNRKSLMESGLHRQSPSLASRLLTSQFASRVSTSCAERCQASGFIRMEPRVSLVTGARPGSLYSRMKLGMNPAALGVPYLSIAGFDITALILYSSAHGAIDPHATGGPAEI